MLFRSIVLAIIGLTTAISLPAFRNQGAESYVETAATTVVSTLRDARIRALALAIPISVRLSSTGTALQVRGVYPDSSPVLSEHSFEFPPGVSVRGVRAQPTVRFFPHGRASGDSLFIHGPDGHATIVIDSWSGRVRVGR